MSWSLVYQPELTNSIPQKENRIENWTAQLMTKKILVPTSSVVSYFQNKAYFAHHFWVIKLSFIMEKVNYTSD